VGGQRVKLIKWYSLVSFWDKTIYKEGEKMKINRIVGTLWAVATLFVMLGCGGGSSSSDGGSSTVSGGPPSAPTTLSLDSSNEIKKNAYYNHYQYEAIEDETLSIQAVLENAITKDMRSECQKSGDTFIVVYDAEMNELDGFRTCTSTMKITFMADGIYVIQIKYPGNKGYFTADTKKH
jgi:hypothetical protein